MDNNQNLNKLNLILSNTLNIPEAKINDDLNPDNTRNWDSFNNISLIAKIQDQFKIKLSLKEIQKIKSVKDIKKVLSQHGVIV